MSEQPLSVKVYIDDITNIEKVCHMNSVSTTCQEKRKVLAHAQKSERNFCATKKLAESVKMSVNDAKTQLLCISGNNDNDINTYIRTSDTNEVQGSDRLKLLGFWFGRRPNADIHVEQISSKFRSRLWALRHLKRSGMPEVDLLKIYETMIRPVLDFASPTYHPLLSISQTKQLEALQKRAAKIIFGFGMSYGDVISTGKMELLENRRSRLCLSFAQKAAANPRFASWFPKKKQTDYSTRNPELYQIDKHRTERMKRNPVTYMRYELNRIR